MRAHVHVCSHMHTGRGCMRAHVYVCSHMRTHMHAGALCTRFSYPKPTLASATRWKVTVNGLGLRPEMSVNTCLSIFLVFCVFSVGCFEFSRCERVTTSPIFPLESGL